MGELCDPVFIFTVSGHSSVTQHFPPENATPPPLGTLITLIPPNSHLQAINLTNIFSKTRNRFAYNVDINVAFVHNYLNRMTFKVVHAGNTIDAWTIQTRPNVLSYISPVQTHLQTKSMSFLPFLYNWQQ